MTAHSRLRVGDEELADDEVRAIGTDVRDGVLWLRAGREDWPAQEPELVTVTRTREDRAAAGEP